MRLHDLTGQKTRLKMCLGCIRMRLKYLMSENIRFKMHLWCIRVVLQYLTDETNDHYRRFLSA